MFTGPDVRVLQIHPTRRCNLRCLHCYSSSGPEERGELDAALLRHAISDAAELGYNMLSVSGGEPFLYPALRDLLEQAHRHGWIAGVVTNGMFLTDRKLQELQGSADLIAISLDGVPESHNRLRANNRAFETMVERLPALRRSGIPFAFLFTLTRHNLDELEWVANFAVEQGAASLQVHPMEDAGRARLTLPDAEPLDDDSAVAWLIVQRLRQIHAGKIAIYVDLLDRDCLSLQPADAAQQWLEVKMGRRNLAWLLSPLVVEADGTVVPLRYGFPRPYALGNLMDSRLSQMAQVWIAARGQAFCANNGQVVEMLQTADLPFVNIYDLVAKTAEAGSVELSDRR